MQLIFYLITVLFVTIGINSSKGTSCNSQVDSLANNNPNQGILQTGWYYVVDSNNGYKRLLDKSNEYYFIDPKPIVNVKEFTVLEVYKNNYDDNYGLSIQLNKKGTEAWADATGESIGKKLGFIFDDKLLYAPNVNSQITFGITALNRGDISKNDLEEIKIIIEREMK